MTPAEIHAAIVARAKTKTVDLGDGLTVTVRELSELEMAQVQAKNYPARDASGKAVPNPDGHNAARWVAAATGYAVEQICQWPTTVLEQLFEVAIEVSSVKPTAVGDAAKK